MEPRWMLMLWRMRMEPLTFSTPHHSPGSTLSACASEESTSPTVPSRSRYVWTHKPLLTKTSYKSTPPNEAFISGQSDIQCSLIFYGESLTEVLMLCRVDISYATLIYICICMHFCTFTIKHSWCDLHEDSRFLCVGNPLFEFSAYSHILLNSLRKMTFLPAS